MKQLAADRSDSIAKTAPADIEFFGWSNITQFEISALMSDRFLHAIVYSGPQVIPDLRKALQQAGTNAKTKIAAVSALAGILENESRRDNKKIAESARGLIPDLVKQLDTNDERYQIALIRTLGTLDDHFTNS